MMLKAPLDLTTVQPTYVDPSADVAGFKAHYDAIVAIANRINAPSETRTAAQRELDRLWAIYKGREGA